MTPPESLADALNARRADTDTVQQALRYYLAERTGDLTPAEMRAALVEAAGGDAAAVDDALDRLKRDTAAVEAAGLVALAAAWEEPGQAEVIADSIDAAKQKMPVIETAIVAIVAMYGLYLARTGGVKKRTGSVKRGADGSFEVSVEEEFAGPVGPLQSIVALFRPGRGKESPHGGAGE